MKLRTTLMAFGIASALAGCAATDPVTDTVEAAPGDTLASLKRLGQTTMDAGDYASAVGYFRRAHSVNEFDFEALLGLGTALVRVGHNDEAVGILRKALDALKNKPSDTDKQREANSHLEANTRRELGNALIALGKPALAITEFEAAFDKSQDARCLNGMGIALDLQGDQAAAQTQYRAGLKIDPDNMSLRNNLALSLAVSGKYRESLDYMEPIARAPNSTMRQRQNLALIYGLAGERDRAAAVARIDLDEASVRQNLVFYETLRAMHDPRKVAAALGLRPTTKSPGL